MATLNITKIPAVMRANQWERGARLMEKWFADPANPVPANGIASTGLITMDWVLRFSRAKEVYDKLVAERIWLNDAARREIVKVLARKNALGNAKQKFPLPRVQLALESDAIQFRVVGGNMDMLVGPMDDLRAALANFTFRVVVAGCVEPIMSEQRVASGPPLKVPSGNYLVTIDEVGIYVKDSYDFNDATGEDQDLGNWNLDTNTVGRTGLNGGFSVHNSDFRRWRTANQRGGDFLIYSDLRVLRQIANNTFTFRK